MGGLEGTENKTDRTEQKTATPIDPTRKKFEESQKELQSTKTTNPTDRSQTSISKDHSLSWLAGRSAEDVLHWLLSAKLGEELVKPDLVKHLGFFNEDITKINLEKIKAEKLCVYKKNNNGSYYITTEEQKGKYNGEEYEKKDIQKFKKE
jgi:hypothetical protein